MFPLKSLIQGVNVLQIQKFLLNKSNATPAAFYSKKTLEELAGVPQRPKRPLNAFTCYVKDVYPEVKTENPKLNSTDLIKLIAKRWETVESPVKSRYFDKFKKDKAVYDKEFEKYKKNLTANQLEDLKTARMEQKEQKEKRLLRSKIRELGKPKKASTPFVRFLHEERKRDPQALKLEYQTFMKQASEKWSKLGDKEKKPFVDAYNKEYAQYKVQLDKWEAQMIKQGNTEIVRRSTIIAPKESAAKSKTK